MERYQTFSRPNHDFGTTKLSHLLLVYKVGDLATAVENNGIDGFDRFGRWKHFDPGSAEVVRVLEGLAAQYEWECGADDPSVSERSPSETQEALWQGE